MAGKEKDAKGKKSHKKHKKTSKHQSYKDGKRIKVFCPKCGPGIFLADHKDRQSCGKCGYMQAKGK